jgi:hypothetical protein
MTDTARPVDKPACVRVAGSLRELKARTGLSLTALAERTPYSKSSWGRYLDGKQLAPRHAVEMLCAMAKEPPGRLLALWELADLEWSGRHKTSTATSPLQDRTDGPGKPASPAAARRSAPRARMLLAAAGAVALAAALCVTALLHTGEDASGNAALSALPAAGCHAQSCAGKNPMIMGCAAPGQARRLGSSRRTRTGARLSFSFSARCDTAWALMWNTRVGDVLQVSLSGGAPQRVKVADAFDADAPLFTPMIDGRNLAGLQACLTPAGGRMECFHP